MATFTVGTLFLAGAVHIGAILLVPYVAPMDTWSKLTTAAGQGRFAGIAAFGKGSPSVPGLDPLFVNGACRLDLGAAPFEITLDGGDRFWSVSLYDPSGTSIFSLNDRTAVGGRLDMIVLTPEQNSDLQSDPPPGIEQKIVVESPAPDLVALVRLFAPNAAAAREAERSLQTAGCAPAALQPPASNDSGG
jgi:uncharacterized membrane protein